MCDVDELLNDAVEGRDLSFAAALVADADGTLWQGGAGDANTSHAAGPDTVFRLFSMTKPIGSLAAMILVDRGQLSLDTEVTSVLPSFEEVGVLETLNGSSPHFRRPRNPVTLRHLLTHTSGLSSGTYNRRHAEWHELTGAPHILSGEIRSMYYPLMFEPGTGFTYGIGVDWACRMVEWLDGRAIDRFCAEEIFEPLGMVDTWFDPELVRDRLAEVKARQVDRTLDFSPPPNPGSTVWARPFTAPSRTTGGFCAWF